MLDTENSAACAPLIFTVMPESAVAALLSRVIEVAGLAEPTRVKPNAVSAGENATDAAGPAVTVTFAVPHTALTQAVMTAVPRDRPKTTPADAATATTGLDEAQAEDAVRNSTVPSLSEAVAVRNMELPAMIVVELGVTWRLVTLTAAA